MKKRSINLQLLGTLLICLAMSFLFTIEPVKTKEDLLNTTCNVTNYVRLGTGNFINNTVHPYVLTCKHVIRNQNNELSKEFDIAKMYQNNKVTLVKGKLVAFSETQDFAIIELNKLPYGSQITKYTLEEPGIGDDAFYFGLISRPGKSFFVKGYVAQKGLPISDKETYNSLYSSTIPGSSGSTVFNSFNLGIGIICQTNDEHSHSFYLPISSIHKSLIDSNNPHLINILDGGCNHSIIEIYKTIIKLP